MGAGLGGGEFLSDGSIAFTIAPAAVTAAARTVPANHHPPYSFSATVRVTPRAFVLPGLT